MGILKGTFYLDVTGAEGVEEGFATLDVWSRHYIRESKRRVAESRTADAPRCLHRLVHRVDLERAGLRDRGDATKK